MTPSPQPDYIEMARMCGAHVMPVNIPTPEQAAEFAAMFPTQAALAAFAEMVRKDERERWAKLCEERGAAYRNARAPGWFEVDHESAQCAAAIRNQQGTQDESSRSEP